MTREEAKETLISVLRDINGDEQDVSVSPESFNSAMLIAIDVLQEPSLPTDVDEAAGEYASGSPFYNTEYVAFKAGAAYERGKYELVYEGNGATPDDRGGYWPSDVKLYARKGGEK